MADLTLIEHFARMFDVAWEDLIYDKVFSLPKLLEVESIPNKYIELLKPLLGFTDDISFKSSIADLRKILALAIPYWNEKPSERGVIEHAIRMVTGNQFRVRNFFDLRMQEGITCLVEELADIDANAISFQEAVHTGSQLGANGRDFEVFDMTSNFTTNDQFAFLIVTYDPLMQNTGTFEIETLYPGTKTGRLKSEMVGGAVTGMAWRLSNPMSEFVTEVRLVDNGTGDLKYRNLTTPFSVGEIIRGANSLAYAVIVSDDGVTLGLHSIRKRFEANETIIGLLGGSATADGEMQNVLDRSLIKFLMGPKTVLPISERIDIVYVRFLESFADPNVLDRWNTSAGVTVPDPGGACLIPVDDYIIDANPNHAKWANQIASFKIVATEQIALGFFAQDTLPLDNSYRIIVDFVAKSITLSKIVAGTVTAFATQSVPVIKPGILEVIRIAVTRNLTSGNLFRVYLSGELKIEYTETTATYSSGGVYCKTLAGDSQIKLVEVNCLPTDIERVGPNP
jgi:hypothetical protein